MTLANYERNKLYLGKNYKHQYKNIALSDKNSSHSIILDLIADGSVVLDVGCSYGYLGHWLKINKNCILYGIDNNIEALNYAKENARYEDVFFIDLDKPSGSDLERFNRLGEIFDYIILADVLEHLKYPAESLIMLSQKLKFYSNILISVPNISNADIILNLIEGKFNYGEEGILDNSHLRFFTRNSFIEWIESLNNEEEKFKFDVDFIANTTYVSNFVNGIRVKMPVVYNLLSSSNPEINTFQNIFSLTKVNKYDKIFIEKSKITINGLEKFNDIFNEITEIADNDERLLNDHRLILEKSKAAVETLIRGIKKIFKLDNRLKPYIDKDEAYKLWININKLDNLAENYLSLLNLDKCVAQASIKQQIDIIIPVYNGREFLDSLFASVIKNTSIPYRILIANDASTDKNVSLILADFKKNNPGKDITIIENEDNLGFVKTINKLVKYTKNHFIILNTDIEVPPYWAERLMYPILVKNNIASTTPFTNAGTICGFPNFLEDNQIFENLDVAGLDSFFQYVDFEKNYIEIPTGVGFCMGINKDVYNKIGMFDESFDKGYGEENDWCMRAMNIGYKNVIIPNLFVFHKHGGSFSSTEKQELIKNNSRLLRLKHPNYFLLVQDFIKEDPLERIRTILKIKILASLYKPAIIIDHSMGGGANEYTDILLSNTNLSIVIKYSEINAGYIVIFGGKKINRISIGMKNINELEFIIKHFSVSEIIINELVSHPKILDLLIFLVEFKKANNQINFVFNVHDFFCICPKYNLLSYEIQYCGIPLDLNYCDKCLNSDILTNYNVATILQDYPHLTIALWREKFKNLLEYSEKIVCFSKSSLEVLKKGFPGLLEDKFKIIPHHVNWVRSVAAKKTSGIINIGILGNVTIEKGSLVIASLISYIHNQNINIRVHIFGNIFNPDKNFDIIKTVIKHGAYKKEDLPELMEANEIDLIFISSIWPETFSYTTEEAISMQLPIAVFDIGAPAERVKLYKKGIILQKQNPEYIVENILRLYGCS